MILIVWGLVQIKTAQYPLEWLLWMYALVTANESYSAYT